MEFYTLSSDFLTVQKIDEIVKSGIKLRLSEDSKNNIIACRKYLDETIAQSDKPIYGINTGFGSLYNVTIDSNHLATLQKNLLLSHACGMGDKLPDEMVRYMLLLKIQSLSYGHSGVSLEIVERLIDFYNNGILPVVFDQGSLGASGDLSPLAHLCLPLIGYGRVVYEGKECEASEVLTQKGWSPIELQSKEGLALLNGTQFMLACATFLAIKAQHISYMADTIACMSLDAFDGRIEPFDELISKIRPHRGQVDTAKFFRDHMEGSEIISQPKKHVQDPYSFRCIPQVHGASKDTLRHFVQVVETEINAVTDNPNIFIEEDKIISGGNFHGQPLALVIDFLAIALAEWASISERRTYLLISGQRGLPPYLVASPGLNSGFMIPQYTAASIVSLNKQYATPSSIDSIVSSNGQEDHVSMGANAATKCLKIMRNVEKVLAIEAFNAAQALDFRRPLKSSNFVENFHGHIRSKIDFIQTDVYMHQKMKDLLELLF
jgi:histidine ammonia-lyase